MDNKIKKIFPLIPGLICFIIYLITLSPSVGFMDSGELAASVYLFGIPHPTGYPLYLLIGYAFSHLPLGHEVIFRLNLLSAIASSAAVVVFFYAVNFFLNILKVHKINKKSDNKGKKYFNENPNLLIYISFITSLCFGLTKTFWSNAVQNEVYGLHALFICIFIYYSLKIYSKLSEIPLQLWSFLFLFLGFSFSNHLTTIFLFPALFYLLYLQYSQSPVNFGKILIRSIFILPGFLLYGILMIAASYEPYFNWSNPVTVGNLIHHMSGGDFSHLLLSTSGTLSKNFKIFTDNYFAEFAILSGIICIAGLIFLYKRNKSIFIYFSLLVISCLGFALNYNVRDVTNFFTLLNISMSVVLSTGIYSVLKYIGSVSRKSTINLSALIVFGILLSSLGFYYNFSNNNSRNDYGIEDFTLNSFENIENGAIVVSYDWGYFYPSSLYYQQVLGNRADLKIIMLRFLAAPWYLNIIKKYHPEIYENISKEAEDYISTYNPQEGRNSAKLINLVRVFFAKNYIKMPVYVTSDMLYNTDLPNLFTNYSWKPGSLCYKLTNKQEPYDDKAGENTLIYEFKPYNTNDPNKKVLHITTAGIYYDYAVYHFKGNKQLALKFIDKSLSFESLPDAVKLKNMILNEIKNK